MKNILKFLAILICFYGNVNAQQMVQKTSDIYKLEEYQSQFINKPLKDLLKEIKPQIKTVLGFKDEYPNFFNFRFTTLEQQRLREGSADDRVSLYITVKEEINWNLQERPKGKELIWSKEDENKYENLTVIKIEIITKK